MKNLSFKVPTTFKNTTIKPTTILNVFLCYIYFFIVEERVKLFLFMCIHIFFPCVYSGCEACQQQTSEQDSFSNFTQNPAGYTLNK